MKKFLKILATAAAVAAVIPYKAQADENGGEVEGLFWKVDWKLDPDYQSDPDINVTLGFNNPFEAFKKESHLFADDLVVDYCCDEGITPNTVMYRDETCECSGADECKCECENACEDDVYASAAEGFEEGCCADTDDEE